MKRQFVIQNQLTCEYVSKLYPLAVTPEFSGAIKFNSWGEAAKAAQNTGPNFEIVEAK